MSWPSLNRVSNGWISVLQFLIVSLSSAFAIAFIRVPVVALSSVVTGAVIVVALAFLATSNQRWVVSGRFPDVDALVADGFAIVDVRSIRPLPVVVSGNNRTTLLPWQMGLALGGSWQGREYQLFDFPSRLSATHSFISCVATSIDADMPLINIRPRGLSMGGEGPEVGLESDRFEQRHAVTSLDSRAASALVDARVMQWLLNSDGAWAFDVQGGRVLAWTAQPKRISMQARLTILASFVDEMPRVVPLLYPARQKGLVGR